MQEMGVIEKELKRRKCDRVMLSFERYCEDCEDLYRWATSGGAPKVEWHDGELGSKWAWAMYEKVSGRNISSASCEYKNIAHVVLKEESKKTRLVITTPMKSYLWQWYLVYRTGKCRAQRSLIADDSMLVKKMLRQYRSYVGVDAKGYGHQIPKCMLVR
ncbi:hypothetical protein V3C99_008195 [Haemonchus contortus]